MDTSENSQATRQPLQRRTEAARHLTEKRGLPYSKGRLAKDAVHGTGPAFQYCGRIPLYDVADLDAFADAVLSVKVRSTSELAPQDGVRRGRPPRKGAAELQPA
jgi:hypothetical protein